MQYIEWVSLGVAAVSLVLAVVSLVLVRRAHFRLDEVTPDVRGLAQRVRGADSEQAFGAIFQQLEAMGRKVDKMEVHAEELNRVVARAIRRIGLVRYDSHDEIKGQLSFALCMLDNRDNGVMLTSVYDLQTCRVFVRGILGGKAQHHLMAEEAQALQQALDEP